MIKVAQYINTIGCDKFKRFILQPFNVNMLFPVSNAEIKTYFDEWRGKDMGKYYKFTNNDKIILEYYSNMYFIIFPNRTLQRTLPVPLTLNDFINDMFRNNVQLYWNEMILDTFEPKEFLNCDDIQSYFINLLNKIDKSHEL